MGTDVTSGVRRGGLGRTSGESQTFAKICGGDPSPSLPANTRAPCPTPGTEPDEFWSQNAYDSINPSVHPSSVDRSRLEPSRVDPSRVTIPGDRGEECVHCCCGMWTESETSEPDYPPRANGHGIRAGTRNARENRFRVVGDSRLEPYCSRRAHNNDKHNAQTRRLLPGCRGHCPGLHRDCLSVSESCCYDSRHRMLRFQNNSSGSSCSQTSFEYSLKDTYSRIVRRSCWCTVAIVITLAISFCALSLGVFNFFLTKNLLCISRAVDAGEEWKCYSSLPELLMAAKQASTKDEAWMDSSEALEKKIIEALPQSQLSLNKPSGTFELEKISRSGRGNVRWKSRNGFGLYLKDEGKQVHVNTSGKYSVYFELFSNEPLEIKLFKKQENDHKRLVTTKKGERRISLQAIVELASHNSLYFECDDTSSLKDEDAYAYFSLFMI
ncbi:uncharacterized protein LOC135479415 [Liolophura sinensis]|uniref:uncharacterized protein LOC135479415 n=1 Tax=Liolophura sinensis TaxID=3198878 RepID=UPI003158D30F